MCISRPDVRKKIASKKLGSTDITGGHEWSVHNTLLNTENMDMGLGQGLSRLCVQRVIWTPRTLFFDSLDTQKFMSEFSDDDFS